MYVIILKIFFLRSYAVLRRCKHMIKSTFQKLRMWMNGGYPSAFYKENCSVIREHNIQLLSVLLGVMTVISFAYFLFDLNSGGSSDMRRTYFVFFFVFLGNLVFLLSHVADKGQHTNIFLIFVLEIIFSFLILTGPVYDPSNISCFIPVFFIVAYMLPIIPLGLFAIIIFVDLAVFATVVYFCKDSVLAQTDIVDSVTCSFIGFVIGQGILHSRLTAIDTLRTTKASGESALKHALKVANTDPLTHVRSRAAYESLETALDAHIGKAGLPPFSIVVCDVNGLKKTNDTQGHMAGDELLISCCRIICNVFQKSPVFRIGGDEFVVFLRGDDYLNRSLLMEKLFAASGEKSSSSFASGIADYDSINDRCVHDVFIRADTQMYENKMLFHKLAPVVREDSVNREDLIAELTTDIDGVFYVNIDTDEIISLRLRGIYDSLPSSFMEAQKNGFDARVNAFASLAVTVEDRKRYIAFMQKANLIKALAGNPRQAITYKARLAGGSVLYYRTTVRLSTRDEKGRWILIDVRNVDETMRGEIITQQVLEQIVSERTADLTNANKKLSHFNDSIVEMLGSIVEARSTNNGKHVRRVRDFSEILARQVMTDCPEYGITEEYIKLISSASALHDIGKIMISDSILLKPDKLTKEEYEIMKTHSEKGLEVLDMIPDDMDEDYQKVIREVCLYHHEKYDGKGYPKKLVGDEIPISAQIVSVADCYDALVSDRPYKKGFPCNEAYDMIMKGECGKFSDKMLSCFTKCRLRFEEQFKYAEK